MSQPSVLKLIKDGATAEAYGNEGIHIKHGEKDLWTDHTEYGIDIWTNNGGTNSRARIDLSMLELVMDEMKSRMQQEQK